MADVTVTEEDVTSFTKQKIGGDNFTVKIYKSQQLKILN